MQALFAIVAFFLATCSVAADKDLLPLRVRSAIEQRIAAHEYPALVVAVVDDGRSVVYTFGKLDDGTQPSADTVFETGSVTKTFTALLLAEEITAGRLAPDAPVSTLLPGFPIPAYEGRFITLESLATQHSGLPRLPSNLQPMHSDDPYVDYDEARLKSFLSSYVLPRAPGSAYEYSNLGVGLLGFALAQRAHASLEKLMTTQIFIPLGMQSSGFGPRQGVEQHLAPGHAAGGNAVSAWHFDTLAGAGGISSSSADMLRYLKANMGRLATPLYPAMQLAQSPRADMDASNRIGLAWMTLHTDHGDVVWHNGGTGGYASFIGFTGDRTRGVVILTNVAQSVDDLGFATLSDGASLRPIRSRIAIPPGELDAYRGRLQLAPGFVLTIFRTDNQLFAQATGQGAFPVFPSAANEFFANVGDIAITFTRTREGAVNGLVLHQGGVHRRAGRLD